jgi:hypothetical protein
MAAKHPLLGGDGHFNDVAELAQDADGDRHIPGWRVLGEKQVDLIEPR